MKPPPNRRAFENDYDKNYNKKIEKRKCMYLAIHIFYAEIKYFFTQSPGF